MMHFIKRIQLSYWKDLISRIQFSNVGAATVFYHRAHRFQRHYVTQATDVIEHTGHRYNKKWKSLILSLNRLLKSKKPSDNEPLTRANHHAMLLEKLQQFKTIQQHDIKLLTEKEVILAVWILSKIDQQQTTLLQLLLDECRQRASKFSALQIATLFYTLGKTGSNHPSLLQQLINPFLRHAHDMKWYELANVSWACAKLQFNNQLIVSKIMDLVQSNIQTITVTDFIRILYTLSELKCNVIPLLGHCHDQFLQQMIKCPSQDFVYMLQLHAMHKNSYYNASFLKLTVQHLLHCNLDSFHIQDLCKVLHLYATVSCYDEALFRRFITYILNRSHKVQTKDIQLMLWSCIIAKYQDRKWFKPVIQMFTYKIKDFTADDIITTLREFVSANYKNRMVLDALYSKILKHINLFSPYHLAMTAWALAKIGYLKSNLVYAIMMRVEAKIDQFNSHDVSSLLWALATVGYTPNSQAIDVLKQRLQQLDQYNAQDLCNSVWALSKLNIFDKDVYDRFAHNLIDHLPDIILPGLSNVASAYSWQSYLHQPLFTKLIDTILSRRNNLNCQSIANIAWSFANLNLNIQTVFDVLINAGIKSIEGFQPFELTAFVWSLAVMKRFPLELITFVVHPNFVNDVIFSNQSNGKLDSLLSFSISGLYLLSLCLARTFRIQVVNSVFTIVALTS